MTRLPQVAFLADGKRLHLQDGPIDLIIEADGSPANTERAYRAAISQFTGLLDALCAELPDLRRAAHPAAAPLKGKVARRMSAAVAPFAAAHFITPMAAVAGAVAEEVLGAMTNAARLERAYVNNGGDIALYLADGAHFKVGLVDRPDQFNLMRFVTITASDASRGIATSGAHGRSFSLGIADSVTVLAATASQADAAATIIANAVDLSGHPSVVREPANSLQPDSDLGSLPVTRRVGPLLSEESVRALDHGAACARSLLARGLIDQAILTLQGTKRIVGMRSVDDTHMHRHDSGITESLAYA